MTTGDLKWSLCPNILGPGSRLKKLLGPQRRQCQMPHQKTPKRMIEKEGPYWDWMQSPWRTPDLELLPGKTSELTQRMFPNASKGHLGYLLSGILEFLWTNHCCVSLRLCLFQNDYSYNSFISPPLRTGCRRTVNLSLSHTGPWKKSHVRPVVENFIWS